MQSVTERTQLALSVDKYFHTQNCLNITWHSNAKKQLRGRQIASSKTRNCPVMKLLNWKTENFNRLVAWWSIRKKERMSEDILHCSLLTFLIRIFRRENVRSFIHTWHRKHMALSLSKYHISISHSNMKHIFLFHFPISNSMMAWVSNPLQV